MKTDVDILRQTQFVDAVFEFVMLFRIEKCNQVNTVEYVHCTRYYAANAGLPNPTKHENT